MDITRCLDMRRDRRCGRKRHEKKGLYEFSEHMKPAAIYGWKVHHLEDVCISTVSVVFFSAGASLCQSGGKT